MVAKNPAKITIIKEDKLPTKASKYIANVITKLPNKLADVPATLIAPSVPGETGLNEVIKKGLFPHRFPISKPQDLAN